MSIVNPGIVSSTSFSLIAFIDKNTSRIYSIIIKKKKQTTPRNHPT